MKNIFIAFFLLAFSPVVLAQEDRIEPERPGETQTVSTVGKRKWQTELGFTIEKTGTTTHHTAEPELLVKYGLLEKFELRLESELARYSTKTGIGHVVTTGLQPVLFGFKTALLKGTHIIPKAALIADVSIPGFSSVKFKTDHVAPRIRLTFQNELSKKIQLGYNIAAEWDGVETLPEYIYTFSPAFEVSPACQLFLEAYGRIKNNESAVTGIDGGLLFYINKNFSLDISSGLGLSKQAAKYFVSIGGALRFN